MPNMFIHITNGDVVANKLDSLTRSGNLSGQVIAWREMYDMGPIDPDLTGDFLLNRAKFFERRLKIPAQLFVKSIKEQEHKVSLITKDAEVVLWFEHDRYDQTMLLYILKLLEKQNITNVSMVSINANPGIEPFISLGQLSEQQLFELFRERSSVTNEQFSQAIRGWEAYASENPQLIETFLTSEHNALPFLSTAFKTHLTYFPTEKNGLNDVEEHALQLINEGISSFAELFRKVTSKRTNEGLSDLHFAALLNNLTIGEKPLIIVENGMLPNYETQATDATISITEAGVAVLAGDTDRITINGIDWWLGGVNLNEQDWRWNGEKLIQK